MFKNNKYGKFLTVLLIIAVIAVVVLLGVLAFNLIKDMYINSDAEDAIAQFESQVKNKVTNNTVTNTEDVEPVEPVDPVEPVVTNTTSNSSSTSSTTMMYKGFVMVGYIEIPATGIKYPVLQEVTPKSIEVAVAILDGPGLNQVGNTTIVGHNYRNGTFFSNNSKIELGDKIYITDGNDNRVEYTVTNKYITTDSDASYMRRDTEGRREISLSTCTTDVKSRLVIWASAD